jgi:hypothetical protein
MANIFRDSFHLVMFENYLRGGHSKKKMHEERGLIVRLFAGCPLFLSPQSV